MKSSKQIAVKSILFCHECRQIKKGKFYYEYYDADNRIFYCGPCYKKLKAERDEIEKNSAMSFYKTDIIKLIRASIRELKELEMNILAIQALDFSGQPNDVSDDIIPIEKELLNKKMKLNMLLSSSNNSNSLVDLNTIKAIDPELIIGREVPKDRNICCPIHNESDPSFRWYHQTNSFYCFGCGASGSIIDLFMAINDCSLKEAISALKSMI